MIEDAKAAWISVTLEERHPVPEPAQDLGDDTVIHIPRTLHKALALQAKAKGVSLKDLVLHYLARA